ncbi:FadR family transcriptional regulator [Flexivirga sp. ID2601S]|uniref:FadR family transcriptional regulator n=1 Tax=Flexivirga aerilata TaxID=1656889 RepID=A0A849AIF0_9MICO|nr:FCD domain-containing protein [Flexivirga aerilata]NNG39008.1 FadR family transcriptional regulator [Flexivirga aerilata]
MTQPITPPRRTSELVVERMEQLIRGGEWPVGTCIPAEPELVRDFGVGRNTIREAVRALEHTGMLQPRRGDGTYVRSANPFAAAMSRGASSAALDLMQVRRALESEAAASAARSASARTRAKLRAVLDRAEAALAAGDLETYTREDVGFHTQLVAAAGNPLMVEIFDGVVEAIAATHAEITATSAAHTGLHPQGHREAIDAIDAGDPEAARAAVNHYIDELEAEIKRA